MPFLPPDFDPSSHMILLEGETDTMACWQAAPAEAKRSIVGLSGLNAWKDGYADSLFGEAKVVWTVFDNDDPYGLAKEQGDKSWTQIKKALGRKAKRVILPQGIEDVAEFFQTYDWAAFRVLLDKAKEPVRHFPRLDLTRPIPKTDWLVEDMIEMGAVTVLTGYGGVGKSTFVQALSLAVAGDTPTWLGLKILHHGNVIHVDEENAADLAIQRLNALTALEATPVPKDGAQRANTVSPLQLKRLDYLWYPGVQMDVAPELLLEEAMDIEPKLIVIDSQSRVSLATDEQSNTEIANLYRKGFIPLARDTGAAVIILHHTPHDTPGRARGAGAIRDASDQTLALVAAKDKAGNETGVINLFPSKPRRRTATVTARISGQLEEEGYLRVEAAYADGSTEEAW